MCTLGVNDGSFTLEIGQPFFDLRLKNRALFGVNYSGLFHNFARGKSNTSKKMI